MDEQQLTKISLEIVLMLRENRRPKEIMDPSRAVPTYILRWLAEQFFVQSSSIYIYQSTGRSAIKKKIIGNKQDWGDLEKEQKNLNSKKSKTKILFDLYYKGKTQKTRKVPFGYIGFKRKTEFREIEIEAIKNIMIFVSDYMYEIFTINRKQFHDYALNRINSIGIRDALPGTIIQCLQGTIHRAIRAYASYFVLIHNGSLIIEYFQKPKWNKPIFAESHPNFESITTFHQLALNNDFFHWADLKPKNYLKSIFSNYINLEGENWEYLIGVVKVSNIPIGLWIFQFNKHQLMINDLTENLIRKANDVSKNQIKYLYQRRTRKMIVNPIFKSRDTVLENNKVFILMPFTESWSDRIWQKLIKPILISEGIEPVRADDLYGRDIMEDIWSGIVKSTFVIADITNRNPNVFYELGIAHTLGKEVILLTQDSKDIPFDLNRYRHIIYEDNMDGYEILENKLKATIRDILRK